MLINFDFNTYAVFVYQAYSRSTTREYLVPVPVLAGDVIVVEAHVERVKI